MRKGCSIGFRILVVFLLVIIFSKNSYAYLDPGTGSYIFQMLIAGFIGGLFAIKLFFNKIKISLKNIFSKAK